MPIFNFFIKQIFIAKYWAMNWWSLHLHGFQSKKEKEKMQLQYRMVSAIEARVRCYRNTYGSVRSDVI